MYIIAHYFHTETFLGESKNTIQSIYDFINLSKKRLSLIHLIEFSHQLFNYICFYKLIPFEYLTSLLKHLLWKKRKLNISYISFVYRQ